MPEKYYEILSLGFRYWFTLLGVLIVWRSFRWLRHDRAEKHRRIRQLPDAGTIGEMVVLEGNDELPEGTTIPVPWEGVLGFVRICDMVLPVSGVARQHADFSFRNGDGLMVVPRHGCVVEIDGEKITGRKAAKVHTMHHGSCLRIGEALLRLRVFMGLETERFARTLPEDESNNPVAAPQGQGMPMRETPYPMQGQDAQGYAPYPPQNQLPQGYVPYPPQEPNVQGYAPSQPQNQPPQDEAVPSAMRTRLRRRDRHG